MPVITLINVPRVESKAFLAINSGSKKAEVYVNDFSYENCDSLLILPYSKVDKAYLNYDPFEHTFKKITQRPFFSNGILVDITYVDPIEKYNNLVVLNFKKITQYKRRSFLLAKLEYSFKHIPIQL
ncbi:hypothetical protein WOSG25_110660 [Weissella oryzae SG25]|uniref:Uncharacterized protein n=1 Tax=Weissella oryzae (strain DSM 25784 / JCM 18191 / LMG 30913 / SG25) TaxID=1329250 RepID=A0A069CWH9_WEIOS|nr:hypothetical protein WOSG25_110660 [Weissella oryzae SG25]